MSREESYYRALLETQRPLGVSIILDEAVPFRDAQAAHEALAHLFGARLKCLLLINELEAGKHYAEDFGDWLRENFRSVTPPMIVANRAKAEAERMGRDPDDVRLEMLPQATRFFRILREQQTFADSIPKLVATLGQRNINGRDYIEQLRSEKERDLVLLEAKDG